MKKIISILLILVMSLSVLLCSCGGNDTDTDTNSDTSIDSGTNNDTDSDSDKGNTTDSDKTPSKPDNSEGVSYDSLIDHKITVEDYLDLSIFEKETQFGNEGEAEDYTNATTIDVSQKANGGSTYNINLGGIYRLTGTTANGQILVNLKDDEINKNVILILDNLNMTYSGQKSVIYIEKCESVKILVPQGSVSTLTDSRNNEEKGVIHVRSCGLTLDGKGTLNLNAKGAKSRGLFNTKTMTINGGTYNITTEYSHGIQGEEGLIINGGKISINSAKSGLKVGDFDKDKIENIVEGALVINGGYTNIKSKTNGISAYGTVTVNDGKLNIESEKNGFDLTSELKEGEAVDIETGENLFNAFIKGGIISISSQGNGLKSDSVVTISDKANVKILAVTDGIDSKAIDISTNGIIYIKTNIDDKAFVEDASGHYIIKNGRYTYIEDATKYPNETHYILESCKGLKAYEAITIKNATVGINSYEDAISSKYQAVVEANAPSENPKYARVVIESGKVILYSKDDGIDVNNTTTYSDKIVTSGEVIVSGELEILYSNKGIKTPSLTVNENGVVTVISSSDAVESLLVDVKGGVLLLLEKLDLTKQSPNGENDPKEEGSLRVEGGTVIVISSTNKAAVAETEFKQVAIDGYTNTSDAKFGNWLRITDGSKSIVFRIPKSYEDKLSVACISEDIDAGTYSVEIGSYQVGERINKLVYVDGNFTAASSQSVTVE